MKIMAIGRERRIIMRELSRFFRVLFAVLLCGHLLSCACGPHSSKSKDSIDRSAVPISQKQEEGNSAVVVARVNGAAIDMAFLVNQIQSLHPEMRTALTRDVKAGKEFLEDIIGFELVIQEAQRQGLDQESEFRRQVDHLTQDQAKAWLFGALLKKELGDKVPEPTGEEVINYYNEKHMETMRRGDGTHLDFAAVEPLIRQSIRTEKMRELYVGYVKRLKSKAQIEIFDSALEATISQSNSNK